MNYNAKQYISTTYMDLKIIFKILRKHYRNIKDITLKNRNIKKHILINKKILKI